MIDRRDEGFSSLGKLQAHAASCVTSAGADPSHKPANFAALLSICPIAVQGLANVQTSLDPVLCGTLGMRRSSTRMDSGAG
jgi:hypothetical protein